MAPKKKSKGRTNIKEEPKIANQPPGVKFYSLVDVVNTERILTEVEQGNLIFLNIGRIISFPDRKKEFLQSLKESSAQLHATLRMVSEETIMVAPQSVPIEIRSLTPVKMKDVQQGEVEE